MACVASWAQVTSGIMDEVCNSHTAEGNKGKDGSEKSTRGAQARCPGILLGAEEIQGPAGASSGEGTEMSSVAKSVQQVGREDCTLGPPGAQLWGQRLRSSGGDIQVGQSWFISSLAR